MNIQNLKYFHSDSYINYYQSSIGKVIRIYIANENDTTKHFWRGEIASSWFNNQTIEVFFYVTENEQITDFQQYLLNHLFENIQKLLERVDDSLTSIYQEYGEEMPSDHLKVITDAQFTLREKNKIETLVWAALDEEHPVIDYEIIDLSVNPIENWQTIDDKKVLELIQEMLNNTINDAILDRNAVALQKRYSKPEGTLIDMIFHQEMDNPQEILKELKKDTIIYL
ncbi:hypothetical protein BKI52_15765 [marine bacterium AO1-C]|nr:hypothetical protein BKI52_15765 [marine bacterium AO1-C]